MLQVFLFRAYMGALVCFFFSSLCRYPCIIYADKHACWAFALPLFFFCFHCFVFGGHANSFCFIPKKNLLSGGITLSRSYYCYYYFCFPVPLSNLHDLYMFTHRSPFLQLSKNQMSSYIEKQGCRRCCFTPSPLALKCAFCFFFFLKNAILSLLFFSSLSCRWPSR